MISQEGIQSIIILNIVVKKRRPLFALSLFQRNPDEKLFFYLALPCPQGRCQRPRVAFSGIKGVEKRATKKHATCLATLLKNELNSDVALFKTTHIKPVLQQIRLLTGSNVAGKTRNIASQFVLQQCCQQVGRFCYSLYRSVSQDCAFSIEMRGPN